MDKTEAQGTPEENVTYPQATDEPVTQVQRDSVITREDVPSPRFRISATVIFLLIFLLVAGIYYTTFSP